MSDLSAVLNEEARWSEEEDKAGSTDGLQPHLLSCIIQEETTPSFLGRSSTVILHLLYFKLKLTFPHHR